MTEHAVVIAGGGPTGLMLAAQLAGALWPECRARPASTKAPPGVPLERVIDGAKPNSNAVAMLRSAANPSTRG